MVSIISSIEVYDEIACGVHIIQTFLQLCHAVHLQYRMDKEILKMYDSIIVLKDGEVCESGPFDELSFNGTIFKQLYAESN